VLSVTLRTLRARWSTFTGSFVALSLGVALLTVMGLALASTATAPERGPERFAAATVVAGTGRGCGRWARSSRTARFP
jgi:putative ABC transport system permease protein